MYEEKSQSDPQPTPVTNLPSPQTTNNPPKRPAEGGPNSAEEAEEGQKSKKIKMENDHSGTQGNAPSTTLSRPTLGSRVVSLDDDVPMDSGPSSCSSSSDWWTHPTFNETYFHPDVHQHPLRYTQLVHRICDHCRIGLKEVVAYRCTQANCSYDACYDCVKRYAVSPLPEEERVKQLIDEYSDIFRYKLRYGFQWSLDQVSKSGTNKIKLDFHALRYVHAITDKLLRGMMIPTSAELTSDGLLDLEKCADRICGWLWRTSVRFRERHLELLHTEYDETKWNYLSNMPMIGFLYKPKVKCLPAEEANLVPVSVSRTTTSSGEVILKPLNDLDTRAMFTTLLEWFFINIFYHVAQRAKALQILDVRAIHIEMLFGQLKEMQPWWKDTIIPKLKAWHWRSFDAVQVEKQYPLTVKYVEEYLKDKKAWFYNAEQTSLVLDKYLRGELAEGEEYVRSHHIRPVMVNARSFIPHFSPPDEWSKVPRVKKPKEKQQQGNGTAAASAHPTGGQAQSNPQEHKAVEEAKHEGDENAEAEPGTSSSSSSSDDEESDGGIPLGEEPNSDWSTGDEFDPDAYRRRRERYCCHSCAFDIIDAAGREYPLVYEGRPPQLWRFEAHACIGVVIDRETGNVVASVQNPPRHLFTFHEYAATFFATYTPHGDLPRSSESWPDDGWERVSYKFALPGEMVEVWTKAAMTTTEPSRANTDAMTTAIRTKAREIEQLLNVGISLVPKEMEDDDPKVDLLGCTLFQPPSVVQQFTVAGLQAVFDSTEMRQMWQTMPSSAMPKVLLELIGGYAPIVLPHVHSAARSAVDASSAFAKCLLPPEDALDHPIRVREEEEKLKSPPQ